MLKLYNQRTGQKEAFKPASKTVGLYVCGPTIYDVIHLGNARSLVCFDVLYRTLMCLYKDVCYVRNITDIDDKINKRAWKENRTITQLTQETFSWFQQDTQSLGICTPSHQPRATDYIPEMISMIQVLLEKGFAYKKEGHVLFTIERFKDYGALSKRKISDLMAEDAEYKEEGGDFVLWKPSSSQEPAWDSPFGRGRPGWHLECSAMSKALLGDCFDIHGGGADLLFPHHGNERAQSCAASGQKENARFWLHNAMLLIEGKKMSKSLGNFQTLRSLLEQYPADILKWTMLSTHYRHPLDWTQKAIDCAAVCIDAVYRALRISPPDETLFSMDQEALCMLCNDLNTPAALNHLYKTALTVLACPRRRDLASQLFFTAKTLFGLAETPPQLWLQNLSGLSLFKEDIEEQLKTRTLLRKEGAFEKADLIREILKAQRIGIQDTKEGPFWHRLWAKRD